MEKTVTPTGDFDVDLYKEDLGKMIVDKNSKFVGFICPACGSERFQRLGGLNLVSCNCLDCGYYYSEPIKFTPFYDKKDYKGYYPADVIPKKNYLYMIIQYIKQKLCSHLE